MDKGLGKRYSRTQRKKHLGTGRALTVFLAAILIALSVLSVVPFSAAAAPGEPVVVSPDTEEISVLSVTVNVNTETEQVFTELILHNESGEEKEVTFSLPEISAGMKYDTLKVKTTGGSDMETDNGVASLTVPPGGNAVLSYSYESKRKLVYEGTIGFDLKQLAKYFSDRIGHLEWTVDLPTSELVMVKEIHPVNYTVADNCIRVVLENFLVSDLMDRCYVSRTTHAALLEEITLAEEEYEAHKAEEGVDDSYTDRKYSEAFRVARYIVSHYRKWYRLPEKDLQRVEFLDSFGEDHSDAFMLFRLYLKEEYPEEDVSILTSEHMIYEIGGEGKEKHGIYREYFACRNFLQWINSIEYGMEYIPKDFSVMYMDIRALLRGILKWDAIWPEDCYNAAFAAQMYPEEPRVYAALLSDPPQFRGRKLLAMDVDYDHALFREMVTFIPASKATWLPYIEELGKGDWHRRECASGDEDQACRTVCISENDFDDPDAVLDYLNALHVRAVEHLQMLPKDSEIWRDFEKRSEGEEYPTTSWYLLSYDGTDRCSFESFSSDLTAAFDAYGNHRVGYPNWGIGYLMTPAAEPFKEKLSVPIFTHYVGYHTSVEQFVAGYEKQSSEEMHVEFYGGPLTDATVVEGTYFMNPIFSGSNYGVSDTAIFDHAFSESADLKAVIEEHLRGISEEEDVIKEKVTAAREELNPAAREDLIPETEPETTEEETSKEPETSEPESELEEPTGGSEKETQEGTAEGDTEESAELSTDDSGNGQTILTPPPTPTAGAPTPAPLPKFRVVGGSVVVVIIAAFSVGILITAAVIVGIVIMTKKRSE